MALECTARAEQPPLLTLPTSLQDRDGDRNGQKTQLPLCTKGVLLRSPEKPPFPERGALFQAFSSQLQTSTTPPWHSTRRGELQTQWLLSSDPRTLSKFL